VKRLSIESKQRTEMGGRATVEECGFRNFGKGFELTLGPSARGDRMRYILTFAALAALATPAFADEVGVGVGPAGVTVGSHRDYDRDRDRDRTVVKEREPSERTTVIKKQHDDGTRSKTVIHDHD
jgi:hypothetical protein